MTTALGLIGWPLTYSLSPVMHTQWLALFGIEGSYILWPTETGLVKERIAALQAQGVRGCNVTIPHKREVMQSLDTCSTQAARINAVNTVVFETDGKIAGHNTDIEGFRVDFARIVGMNVPLETVLVLGAGGAAAAVFEALRQSYPAARILVAARKDVKGENVEHVPWDSLNAVVPKADAIINATPLGKENVGEIGLDWTCVRKNAVVYDLNYHARETALVHAARAQGLKACDGLSMLARQAQEAFALWTGKRPNVDDAFLAFVRGHVGAPGAAKK